MSEAYKQAEKDYIKGMKYKDIAEKYDVSLNTVKSWKQRYGWNRKKGAHKEKSMHTKNGKVAIESSNKSIIKKEVEIESLPSDNLTDKQRLFCLYYVKYWNATKAYQKAYECAYSTAMVNGSRSLGNAKIKAEIDRMKAEQAKGIMLDAQFVLQKYIDIAFADITDFVTFGKKEVPLIGLEGPIINEDGEQVTEEVNYVDFHEASEIDGAIVTEVKKGKDGVSIKLADKMKALDMLAKYFDLFPDKFKQQIEEEKLKLSKDKFELEKTKIIGDEEEHEDDGFLEALQGKVSEVWEDEED